MVHIAVPRDRFLLFLLLFGTTACNGWTFGENTAEGAESPYDLSIVETRGCPLPEGLDEKEKRILGVHVRLEGHHARGVPANYFYASVLTEDGSRYLAELPGCEPVLSGAPLAPGDVEEGFLNFPLPVSKTPKTLVYAPELEALDVASSRSEVPLP